MTAVRSLTSRPLHANVSSAKQSSDGWKAEAVHSAGQRLQLLDGDGRPQHGTPRGQRSGRNLPSSGTYQSHDANPAFYLSKFRQIARHPGHWMTDLLLAQRQLGKLVTNWVESCHSPEPSRPALTAAIISQSATGFASIALRSIPASSHSSALFADTKTIGSLAS